MHNEDKKAVQVFIISDGWEKVIDRETQLGKINVMVTDCPDSFEIIPMAIDLKYI